jgi:hypothetical protein
MAYDLDFRYAGCVEEGRGRDEERMPRDEVAEMAFRFTS